MSRLPVSRPTVLMYHGFSHGPREDDPYDLHVPDDAFAAQLAHLAQRWTPLDLDGYLAALVRRRAPRRSFLLTIDDALCSVGDIGAPLLARAGVPSVLFVPVGLVGRTSSWLPEQPAEPLLDADRLRDLAGSGVELGVHGWAHESMAGLEDAGLRRATVDARDALADLTGRRPRSFAYPYGHLDARAVDAVARAGYEVGFSVYRDAGRHALSRTDVKPADSLTAVRVKLAAGPRYRALWQAAGWAGPARSRLRAAAQRR